MRINRKVGILTSLVSTGLFLSFPAQAVCPICTVAVGAGVGLARYIGVDDTIIGTWIGGLVISLALWTVNWLGKKNWKIKSITTISIAFYYLIVVVPLYWMGIMGHPGNQIYGIDKLLVGIIFGSLGFILGSEINLKIKESNGGKVLFPFQKVAFGLLPLFILSGIFFVIATWGVG
jgi:hypothetical protein